MKKPKFFIAALIICVSFLFTPESTPCNIIEHFQFDVKDFGKTSFQGYDLIYHKDQGFMSVQGAPMLPAIFLRIPVPLNKKIIGLEVRDSNLSLIKGSFDILPWYPPTPYSTEPQLPCSSPFPDPLVYESVKYFPGKVAEYSGTGLLSENSFAQIILYPIQYTPYNKRIFLIKSFSIELDLENNPSDEIPDSTGQNPVYAQMFNDLIVVNNVLEKSPLSYKDNNAPDPESITYLIITNQELSSNFERLCQWKTLKGYPGKIITTEEIYGRFRGRDKQEMIRTAIKYFHDKYKTVFVLLGGDVDVIPVRKAHIDISNIVPYYRNIPCDLYYSDLDGDWNYDGDNLWGEYPDDIPDFYSDVFVGRAPVITPEDVDKFVDKVLIYEMCPDASPLPLDYELDCLLVGEELWSGHSGGTLCNILEDEYIPERINIIKLYENDNLLSETNLRLNLNRGFNIVNNVCHGTAVSIELANENWEENDMDSLTNAPRFGLWYSTSCMVSQFDTDCIAEHWLKADNGGGVFFIGNARYGWAMVGYPGAGPSDKFNKAFFEVIFQDSILHMGAAHSQAKNLMVTQSYCDKYKRYCLFELNLLGDPETELWTNIPRMINVEHPDTHVAGSGALFIHTDYSDGAPAKRLVVSICGEDGKSLAISYTDSTGSAFLDGAFPPESMGTIVVSGSNVIPNKSSIWFKRMHDVANLPREEL